MDRSDRDAGTSIDAAKLDALREAIQVGIDAIERGDYREFASAEQLVSYLRRLSDSIIRESST